MIVNQLMTFYETYLLKYFKNFYLETYLLHISNTCLDMSSKFGFTIFFSEFF